MAVAPLRPAVVGELRPHPVCVIAGHPRPASVPVGVEHDLASVRVRAALLTAVLSPSLMLNNNDRVTFQFNTARHRLTLPAGDRAAADTAVGSARD